jgi:hypothetical protein
MNSKNQVIFPVFLGLGLISFAGATALPFNDRIELKIGNRFDSRPAWLVSAKAEFKGIERGARWHQNLACSVGNWWYGNSDAYRS